MHVNDFFGESAHLYRLGIGRLSISRLNISRLGIIFV
jgi:hypothetical protein